MGTLRASVGARGARRSVARQSEERIHPLSVAGGKERASDVLVGVVSRHLSVSRTPARSSAYSGRVSTMPYPLLTGVWSGTARMSVGLDLRRRLMRTFGSSTACSAKPKRSTT